MQALIIPCTAPDRLYAEILCKELKRIHVATEIADAQELKSNLIINTNIVIMVPGHHGTEKIPNIIGAIRKIRATAPIAIIDIMHSEKIQNIATANKASYLAGPFSFPRLAVELGKIACGSEEIEDQRWLKVLGIWLDLERRMVRLNNTMVSLRNKEFSLLEFFMINRGRILSRDTILEHVWDRSASFSSNTVDVHVNRLRKKIEPPFGEKVIHTVHCIGYLFDKDASAAAR